MNALAEIETARTQVARPLKVLAQLIKEDLEKARDAAERAGLPYYEAAGAKMLEAKPQLQHGEFQGWIKRNFAISADHARKYMQYAKARQNGFTKPVSSLSDFIQQTSSPSYNKPNTVRPREWHEPVKESIERARRDADRVREEQLSRAQEREEVRKLALRIIDIGFKVLSKELHPDKGGSRDAMARLNRAREILKASA